MQAAAVGKSVKSTPKISNRKQTLAADQLRARRIGVDGLDSIFLIENHDEALQIWRDAGTDQRILVHVDAHHDMWWADNEADINIGNFICQALRHDLLGEVFWVVPDAAFENEKATKPVIKHLKRLLSRYQERSKILVEPHRLVTAVLGKKFTICPLSFLPMLRQPILLDVDVDYFVISRVFYGARDKHSPLPWCWPNELVKVLRKAGLKSDLVTIVYSVEGGFTPLQWKYLGQELALLLREPTREVSALRGMRCIREGAEAEERADTGVAESKYRQAQTLLPQSAAAPYRLARLLANQGRVEEARQLYTHAVTLDHSYGGAYISGGFHYYWGGDLAAAEREFRCAFVIDPKGPYVLLGLGLLALKQKRWHEAERHLRTTLDIESNLLDARRNLGYVLTKLKRNDEAIEAWECALKLGLSGHKSLDGPILTNDHRLLSDPWHCNTYARLAILYAQKGATQAAIDALRIGIAGGLDNVNLRLQLARLYWRQGKWKNILVNLWKAMMLLPKGILSSVRLCFYRARLHAANSFVAPLMLRNYRGK